MNSESDSEWIKTNFSSFGIGLGNIDKLNLTSTFRTIARGFDAIYFFPFDLVFEFFDVSYLQTLLYEVDWLRFERRSYLPVDEMMKYTVTNIVRIIFLN